MKSSIIDSITQHQLVVNSLLINNMENIERFCAAVVNAFKCRGKLLIAGNGGSAADSQHLSAEFVGRFQTDRLPLPAIALTTDTSIMSAVGNDFGFENIYVRQVQALCESTDVLLMISTSGNSENLIRAAAEARKKNAVTVGLLGKDGGKLSKIVDIPIIVDSGLTARIQECHILIGHILCEICDENFTNVN